MPVLFAAVLVIMGSFAMLLPSIMFVLGNMGLSNSLSTPIIAAYSLAQFFAGPQWGHMSDRLGRKRGLAVALFFGAVSYFLMATFADSVFALFATMICAGLCAGSLAIVFAAVSDMTDRDGRTKGMGLIGAGIGLSFVVGTAIGGSISGADALTASIVGPAYAGSFACLLGSCIVMLFMRETRVLDAGQGGTEDLASSRLAAFRKVAKHPALLKLCFLILAFTFCLALMEPVIPKYIFVHFDWGPVEMRNIFIYIGAILVVVQGGVVGPLARKVGEVQLVFVGLILMGAGLFLLAAWPSPFVLYAALTLTSVGTAVFNAAGLSLASHEAEEHERGAVMGVAQSMQALGRSFGPMIAGVLFDASTGLPFAVGAAIVLVVVFLLRGLTRKFHVSG